MADTTTLEEAATLATSAPVFAATDRADTNLDEPNIPNIGNPLDPYSAFIYAAAVGAVVFEYTANME